MRIISLVTLFSAFTSPVFGASLLSYGMATADAKVISEGKIFSVYIHPHENLLLLQPKLFQANTAIWNIADYRAAAELLVAPVGCGIQSVHAITIMGETWEAEYVCPTEINLRELIKTQRPSLKRGLPLHL